MILALIDKQGGGILLSASAEPPYDTLQRFACLQEILKELDLDIPLLYPVVGDRG